MLNTLEGKDIKNSILTNAKVKDLLQLLNKFSDVTHFDEYDNKTPLLTIKKRYNTALKNSNTEEVEVKGIKQKVRIETPSFFDFDQKKIFFDINYNNNNYVLSIHNSEMFNTSIYAFTFFNKDIKHELSFEKVKESFIIVKLETTQYIDKYTDTEKDSFIYQVNVKFEETTFEKNFFHKPFSPKNKSVNQNNEKKANFIEIKLFGNKFNLELNFDESLNNINGVNNFFKDFYANNMTFTQKSENFITMEKYFNEVIEKNDKEFNKEILNCMLYNKSINKEYKDIYRLTNDLDFSFFENFFLSNESSMLGLFEKNTKVPKNISNETNLK